MNYEKETEFVKDIKFIGYYWSMHKELDKELIIHGVIHSILTYIDGYSSLNDFQPITMIDTKSVEKVSCGYLHDIFGKDKFGENKFVDDLNKIMKQWFMKPNLTIEEIVYGMLSSIFLYLDGKDSLNSYSVFKVVDIETDEFWSFGHSYEIYKKILLN